MTDPSAQLTHSPAPDGLVHSRIDDTNKQINETNKRIDSRFAWLITTMGALTGILIAVIKL